MYKITSYWAAEGVTGSKHLIEVWWKKILLDCWMFQWRREESMKRNREFWFDPKILDVVIISHAHIDHCWLLPKLVKDWYDWPIYCTPATKDLLKIMLNDSAHIQESDYEFFKRHRELKWLPEKEPLYTEDDVPPVLEKLIEMPIHKSFEIWEVQARFFWAGHIIWAAMIQLIHKWQKLLFTWDLWREAVPILKDAETPDTDILIMETTYWWRRHEPVSLNRKSIVEAVNDTARKWWKVIIPSFALERTQEILYYLEEALKRNEIPHMNVYVDSPMAIKVTSLFKRHTQCYDEEMQERYEGSIAFQNRSIVYTSSVEESKALNEINFPCVIISASWMCEAWRIRHHLANNIQHYRNTILIVWYMAEWTLWRKLVEWYNPVNIFWKPYTVNAEVKKLNSFSGHADEEELLNWLSRMNKKPKKIVLVHWEPRAQKAIKEKIDDLWIKSEIAKFWVTIEVKN